MFHLTSSTLYFVVPQFHKHTKSTYRAAEFLLPHSSRKFIDKTTMSQYKIDHKGARIGPYTKTLHHLSTNMNSTFGGATSVLHGKNGIGGARAWIFGALNPYNRDRYEWTAPWQSVLTNHQLKQRMNRGGNRTSHVVEATGNDDHYTVSSTDNLDKDAHLLALKTESRWPLVKKIVFESFEWWKQIENEVELSASSSSSSSSSSLPPLDEATLEKLLATFSPNQIRAMKSRTYSFMSQGYVCCLGNFRDFPLEMGLLAGFGENIVALSTDPGMAASTPTMTNNKDDDFSVGSGGGGASRLFSLLIQVLFIGLLRHQSVADFRTLGLSHVGKLAQHPLGVEKLPNLTSQIMKTFLKKNDIDGAIKLGYATCVYCSPSENNSNNSSSFGISSIPINCIVIDSTRKLPQYIQESHFPYSRPFITLSYCWGWNHDMCSNIQEICSAAWLFELSAIALVSMVDCPVPCGVRRRILKAIKLVSASCDRWLTLIKANDEKKNNLSDSERWSSASILISLKRLSPVLEMLSVVENHEEVAKKLTNGEDEKIVKQLTSGENSLQEVKVGKYNDDDGDSEEEEDSSGTSSSSKRSKTRSVFATCSRRTPPTGKTSIFEPTSLSPSQVGIPQFLKNNNSKSPSGHQDDEYDAASFFGNCARSAVEECFNQIGPYFDLEIENRKQQQEESRPASSSSSSSSSSQRFNVPRSVLAEVADACEFISTCPVFVGSPESNNTMRRTRQEGIKKNYEKLNEKLQQVVLG